MSTLTRRSFVFLGATAAAAGSLPAFAGRPLPRPRDSWEPTWTDVVDWPIEGRAFADRKSPYDRLPARAEGVVRKAVWDLSRDSAGMLIRLQTTSPELHVRYRLSRDRLALAHMPATGASGVDLYGRDGNDWRWIDVTRPNDQNVTARLFVNQPAAAAARPFLLYLPLYNGIEKLELGVADGSRLEPMPARPAGRQPIVCYGTSIMHGASASRPGMAWPAIVGRALDREAINFGFSGNGRMETEVGQYLCELDPAAFVVDCLPNMTPKMVAERTQPLIQQLRAKHPDTPILLIEDRTFANAWFYRDRRAAHAKRRQALRAAIEALRQDGVEGLHLLAGEHLLGADGEGTTDGSHPNDLGMMRQADAVTAALRPLLAD